MPSRTCVLACFETVAECMCATRCVRILLRSPDVPDAPDAPDAAAPNMQRPQIADIHGTAGTVVKTLRRLTVAKLADHRKPYHLTR